MVTHQSPTVPSLAAFTYIVNSSSKDGRDFVSFFDNPLETLALREEERCDANKGLEGMIKEWLERARVRRRRNWRSIFPAVRWTEGNLPRSTQIPMKLLSLLSILVSAASFRDGFLFTEGQHDALQAHLSDLEGCKTEYKVDGQGELAC